MKHRVIVLSLVLAALATVPAFAAKADSILETEFNKPGQVNLNAGARLGFGSLFGLGAVVGGEYILTKFDIPKFPLEFGIAARAYLGFPGFRSFDWGVAPMATLHKGFDFGPNAQFDLYIGAGVGFGGDTGGYGIGIGFATFDGLAWRLTDNLWLMVEYGGIYGWQVSTTMTNIGVRFVL